MDTQKSWHFVARTCNSYQPIEDINARYGDFIKKDIDADRSIIDELRWAKEMNDKEILPKDVTNVIVTMSIQLPYQYSKSLKTGPFCNELLFTNESLKKILSNSKITSFNKGQLEAILYLITNANRKDNQPITIEGKDRKFSQGMFNRLQGLRREQRENLAQLYGKDIFINTNYQEPSFINKLLGDNITARTKNAELLGSKAKLITRFTLKACTIIAAQIISPETYIGLGAGIIASELTPIITTITIGLTLLVRLGSHMLTEELSPPIAVKVLPIIISELRTATLNFSGVVIGNYCDKAGDYIKDQTINSFKETNIDTLKRRGFRMESILPETDTYEDIKRRYDFNWGKYK